MKTLIRDPMVLTMAPGDGVTSRQCDILVEGNRITAMGSGLQADAGTTVIDGRNKLVTPGLINAHTHSSETFLKGRYEKMPLETWLLYAYPFFIGDNVPPRLIYLRCMLLAMESLRNGVTTLCDDFLTPRDTTLKDWLRFLRPMVTAVFAPMSVVQP